MNILKKANKIVFKRKGQKEKEYGPFSECNRRAAKIASILCSREITIEEMYNFQISLKLARESWCHKEDNLLDLVAYIAAFNNYLEGINVKNEDIIKLYKKTKQ